MTHNICIICNFSFKASRIAKYCSKKCSNRGWYLSNREHRLAKNKSYRQNPLNTERINMLIKKWFFSHKEYISLYKKIKKQHFAELKKQRYKHDLNFRLAHILRSRIYHALNTSKTNSTMKLLGCSLNELRLYLESKFLPDMSWENYGKNGWHIDHIRPLSSFDLSDPNQLKTACHYTNLQPLWARDNLKKGDKYEESQKQGNNK